MKWEDLKESSEYAEALSLIASLVTAIIALSKAQDHDEKDDKAGESVDDKVSVFESLPKKIGFFERYVTRDKLVVVGAFCFVIFHLLFILLIAYKVM